MSNPQTPPTKPQTMQIGNPDIARFLGMPPPNVGPLPEAMAKPVPLPDNVTPVAETGPKPEDIVPKTPYEEYVDALKELKVSPDEAANIVDSLIIKGYYEETYKLNGKFDVRFRTRTQDVTQRIDRALADLKPEYNASYGNLVAIHNVASSLVQYNKYLLEPYKDDAEFEKTLKFVQKLPQPVFQLLVAALTKFDQKMFVVSSATAVIANF